MTRYSFNLFSVDIILDGSSLLLLFSSPGEYFKWILLKITIYCYVLPLFFLYSMLVFDTLFHPNFFLYTEFFVLFYLPIRLASHVPVTSISRDTNLSFSMLRGLLNNTTAEIKFSGGCLYKPLTRQFQSGDSFAIEKNSQHTLVLNLFIFHCELLFFVQPIFSSIYFSLEKISIYKII